MPTPAQIHNRMFGARPAGGQDVVPIGADSAGSWSWRSGIASVLTLRVLRRRPVGGRGGGEESQTSVGLIAPGPTVVLRLPEPSNVESMTVGTGSFESYWEVIARGRLRGRMGLASACLSLLQLV
jgi:hypothetical protein